MKPPLAVYKLSSVLHTVQNVSIPAHSDFPSAKMSSSGWPENRGPPGPSNLQHMETPEPSSTEVDQDENTLAEQRRRSDAPSPSTRDPSDERDETQTTAAAPPSAPVNDATRAAFYARLLMSGETDIAQRMRDYDEIMAAIRAQSQNGAANGQRHSTSSVSRSGRSLSTTRDSSDTPIPSSETPDDQVPGAYGGDEQQEGGVHEAETQAEEEDAEEEGEAEDRTTRLLRQVQDAALRYAMTRKREEDDDDEGKGDSKQPRIRGG